jgi:hypothetical protein
MPKARGAIGKSRFKKRNSPEEETALPTSRVSLGGMRMVGEDNNIFTQIGLIVLVGLASKNAVLIVGFARELEF